MFCIELIPCAYETKYSEKFNVFSLFSGYSLVSKIGDLLNKINYSELLS